MSKIVQDYTLTEVIGSGQYGKVWKARHNETGESFAIKSISIQQISAQEKLKEFVASEIAALELISNPYIVKYFGKLQTPNNIYLIFEFCRGGTLEDLLKAQGPLDESKALYFFSQILSAFSELHRLHIMHRDLKPSNILLDGGVAKLADFGFCKKMRGEFEMTKSMVGSPIYMAPELLQGSYYCTKADIWSLGVVLYEMLHGRCPYEENSIPALLDKIKAFPDIAFRPDLSMATRVLLQGMLTFNPSTRMKWSDLLSRSAPPPTLSPSKPSAVLSINQTSITNSYIPVSPVPSQSFLPPRDLTVTSETEGQSFNGSLGVRYQSSSALPYSSSPYSGDQTFASYSAKPISMYSSCDAGLPSR